MKTTFSDRRIGIVGGMGPAAGHYFAQKLTTIVPATTDQDHPVIIHLSNPLIPDRTAFLKGQGADPVPAIVSTIRELEQLAPDVICMPCNTAHAPEIFERVQAASATPIINMVESTVAYIARKQAASFVVFGTDGTRQSDSYGQAARAFGLRADYPSHEQQQALMRLIYGIKQRGVLRQDAHDLADIVAGLPAGSLPVMACTELSLLTPDVRELTGKTIIDSLEVLAYEALYGAPDQGVVLTSTRQLQSSGAATAKL